MTPSDAAVIAASGVGGAATGVDRRHTLHTHLLLFALVVIGATLSRAAAFSANEFSLIWPPAGIAFAALESLGLVAAVPVALGLGLWVAVTYSDTPVLVPFAVVAGVLGPLVGVDVQRRLIARASAIGHPLTNLRRLLTFYLSAILVGAPVAALVGASGLAVAGLQGGSSFVNMLIAFWLVESLGLILFGPAVGVLLRSDAGQRLPRVDLPTFAAALGLSVLCAAMERYGATGYSALQGYFFLPLAAFCGVRCTARTNHWTLLACAALFLTAHAMSSQGVMEAAARERALFEQVLVIFLATGLAHVLQAVSADRSAALRAVEMVARQDPATGVLNSRGIEEALTREIATGGGSGFAVVGIRLRNLEVALELLDAAAGARLLGILTRTLGDRPGVAAVARPESSRFMVILRAPDPAGVEHAAAGLLSELEEVRVSARSAVLRLSPTVGALWVERRAGLGPDAIRVALRDAENAAGLHVERPLHLGRLDDVGMAAHLDRLSATERVREAIASQRLVLLAQPIVANAPAQVATGHDVEVLVRLLDPEGTLITPAEFLPIVASADLAVALDRAVVARVFDWFRDRPHVLARTAKCAINLSATSLADPDFPRFVEAAMAARGLAADRLAFEITESSQLINPALAAASLARLRGLGFRVALDDFGTGLSTFDYLKKLPVDYIKIDGAFIRDLENDPMDAEIVASMVRVAASCGLRTVAEYVSSESLRARVTALGVDYSQGYAIGRPIPIEEALA